MTHTQRANYLGEAVFAARKAARLTQVQIATALDYDYNAVSPWENGAKRITLGQWERLCELLPTLDPALAETHRAELAPEVGTRLPPRPSRLDSLSNRALNQLLTDRRPGQPVTEVAAEMGLDYVAFWRMLKGINNPTISQVRAIATYFGADTDQVLGVRPVGAPTYAALLALVAKQREELVDLARVRKLNDLLLASLESRSA